MLYLEDAFHCDILFNGGRTPVRRFERGSVCLVDLSAGASIALHAELRSLAFLLPKALIQEVKELSHACPEGQLRCRRGEADPVLSNLGGIILNLFDGEAEASEAILRHLAIAVCAHLVEDCIDEAGGGENDTVLPYNREAAAKEFMRRNLSREVSVTEIAAAIGLSANHFSQSFKKVTGFTPHQWLMLARVDAAKDLLSGRDLTLKAIADTCGFVDQSQFTKVFSRETGVTPAVWRARRLH